MNTTKNSNQGTLLHEAIQIANQNIQLVEIVNSCLVNLVNNYEEKNPNIDDLQIFLSVNLDKQEIEIKETFKINSNKKKNIKENTDDDNDDNIYESDWVRALNVEYLPKKTNNTPVKERIDSPMYCIFKELEDTIGIKIETLPIFLSSIYFYSPTLNLNKNNIVEVDGDIYDNTYVNHNQFKKQKISRAHFLEKINKEDEVKTSDILKIAKEIFIQKEKTSGNEKDLSIKTNKKNKM